MVLKQFPLFKHEKVTFCGTRLSTKPFFSINSGFTVLKSVKVLGVEFNNKQKFYEHKLCKSASRKPNAFARLGNWKLQSLVNAIVKSQLNYYPLIWMFVVESQVIEYCIFIKETYKKM